MEGSLAEVRRLVHNLRPPALDELGLVGAIRSAVMPYGGKPGSGLHISVEAPCELPTLPAAVEVAAYRIVQEALTNVARHAQATACQVKLEVAHHGDGTMLRLTIVDDGVGLPSMRQAGVGLISMRERAEELGGGCVIESLPERGTTVGALLPIMAATLDLPPESDHRKTRSPINVAERFEQRTVS